MELNDGSKVMELFMVVLMVFYLICAITPIFGQILVVTVMIRRKLVCKSDNSYLLIGMLFGDFLSCCATLWQFALNFIDPLEAEPFFTKGQCLLMEAPSIVGLTISQIATLSLAVDRMNALRDPLSYYQNQHFKFAVYCLNLEGILGLLHAAMPQIANDVGTLIHYRDPTWPTWFRWYWMGFSIIISTLVLLAYLLVIVFSRSKSTSFTERRTSLIYERSAAREKLITKTVLRVLTVYALFWALPSIVYNFTAIFNVNLGAMFGLLIMLGSVLCAFANVVFLLMRGDIRTGVKSLFGCWQQGLHSISGTIRRCAFVKTARVAPLASGHPRAAFPISASLDV